MGECDWGAMIRFVAERCAEDIEQARWSGNMLVTHGVKDLNVSREAAERRAQRGILEAEARQELFEKTVRPYLGTAGPTGRIAEEQLVLLAASHQAHPDYEESWRP